MEGEDLAAAGVWLEGVGELGYRAGGFVAERQRPVESRHRLGKAAHVASGLELDALEGPVFGLGFHHPDSFAVGVEQVISLADAWHGELAHGYTLRGVDVQLVAVLKLPAAFF